MSFSGTPIETIANQAALELAIIQTYDAALATSTDANVSLLYAQLQAVIDDLIREYDWPHLIRRGFITTSNGTEAYVLTGLRLVSGTVWNQTTSEKLLGPVNAQQWEELKNSTATSGSSFYFRVFDSRMYLYPTPSAAYTISYEYITTAFSAEDDEEHGLDDELDNNIWFDKRLLVTGTKLYWLRQKGFDTSFAQADFDKALQWALSASSPAPVLSLNARGVRGPNVPDTGFGS